MDCRFDRFPKEVLHRAAYITSSARNILIHKGLGDRSNGEVQVLEITAWAKGTLTPDDILCRDYYAVHVSPDPEDKEAMVATPCNRAETLRWAHVLFHGGCVPPPVFPRATEASANA